MGKFCLILRLFSMKFAPALNKSNDHSGQENLTWVDHRIKLISDFEIQIFAPYYSRIQTSEMVVAVISVGKKNITIKNSKKWKWKRKHFVFKIRNKNKEEILGTSFTVNFSHTTVQPLSTSHTLQCSQKYMLMCNALLLLDE